MSSKSLRRRDIKRRPQSDRSLLLSELRARLKEIHKNMEYLDKEEFNKLDEKERDDHAALWGEYFALTTLISEIRGPIRKTREPAKAKERELENKRKRERLEARERERIRNLPPIDQKKWARRQRTLNTYLEYRERAKRLKKEPTY